MFFFSRKIRFFLCLEKIVRLEVRTQIIWFALQRNYIYIYMLILPWKRNNVVQNNCHVKWTVELYPDSFTILYTLKNVTQNIKCHVNSTVRAHVGGRFGRRSRLVKVDFAFSLVKNKVRVGLCRRPRILSTCHLWKCQYCARVYWNLS